MKLVTLILIASLILAALAPAPVYCDGTTTPASSPSCNAINGCPHTMTNLGPWSLRCCFMEGFRCRKLYRRAGVCDPGPPLVTAHEWSNMSGVDLSICDEADCIYGGECVEAVGGGDPD